MRLRAIPSIGIILFLIIGVFLGGITSMIEAAGTRMTSANMVPHLSEVSINPNTIFDNVNTQATFSAKAVDSDGTVIEVTVACAQLWTGEWHLSKGSGDTWSETFKILAANITGLGVHDVTFKAIDDDLEWNETVSNIVVQSGPRAPVLVAGVTDPYEIIIEEDSPNLLLDLWTLVEDDDIVNVTFYISIDGDFNTQVVHESFTAAIEDLHWVNITLEEDAWGQAEFTVNASDHPFFLWFNISFYIVPMDDVPVWYKLEKINPAGGSVFLIYGENVYLDVDEDKEYEYTITANDPDGDDLVYKTNITWNERFILDTNGNISFSPTQEDVGFGVHWAHMYAEIQVFDETSDNTPANMTTIVFNVSNVNDPPDEPAFEYEIIDAIPSTSEEENLTVIFYVTRPTDPDGDTRFTYDFDFGDGLLGYHINPTSEETIEVEYTYSSPGYYYVNVTVSDSGGGTTTVDLDEITVYEPGPIWWIRGFEYDDKADECDDDVEVAWSECKIDITMEDIGDDTTKATLVYSLEGTCSDNVIIIHIYWGTQINDDDFTYYPYYDMDNFEKLEIEPDSGVWSYFYSYEIEYPTPEPYDDDIDPLPDTYTTWFAAIAWTEEGTFNFAETILMAYQDNELFFSDQDNDELADSWEWEHFGGLNQNENDDFDRDGFTNLEEYKAGTDPDDEDSHPEDSSEEVSLVDYWWLFLIIAVILIMVTIGIVIVVILFRGRQEDQSQEQRFQTTGEQYGSTTGTGAYQQDTSYLPPPWFNKGRPRSDQNGATEFYISSEQDSDQDQDSSNNGFKP